MTIKLYFNNVTECVFLNDENEINMKRRSNKLNLSVLTIMFYYKDKNKLFYVILLYYIVQLKCISALCSG